MRCLTVPGCDAQCYLTFRGFSHLFFQHFFLNPSSTTACHPIMLAESRFSLWVQLLLDLSCITLLPYFPKEEEKYAVLNHMLFSTPLTVTQQLHSLSSSASVPAPFLNVLVAYFWNRYQILKLIYFYVLKRYHFMLNLNQGMSFFLAVYQMTMFSYQNNLTQ